MEVFISIILITEYSRTVTEGHGISSSTLVLKEHTNYCEPGKDFKFTPHSAPLSSNHDLFRTFNRPQLPLYAPSPEPTPHPKETFHALENLSA